VLPADLGSVIRPRHRKSLAGASIVGSFSCGGRRDLKRHIEHVERRLEWLEDVMCDEFAVFDNGPSGSCAGRER
jgi:hypothetical protein